MAKRKCEQVSIELKYNSIIQIENKIKKQTEIATELGVGTSTVSGWLKQKDKIFEEYNSCANPNKKLELEHQNIQMRP